MPNKFKVPLFVLLLFLISNPVTAELLWPFQIGLVSESRRCDNNGDCWTNQGEVLDEVTLGSKKYFHLRGWNYRPGEVTDVYVRVTETAAYIWNGVDEDLAFQIGPVGTTWSNEEDITEIVAIESVTVPYGGPYTAYVHRKHKLSGSPYWYEYVVPGIGPLKEVDYYTDNAPKINELIRVCYDGAANFTAAPLSGSASLTVSFTDQSCGTITSWSWDFGDGSTSSEQNPSHTYTNPGIYTVSLTVVGPGGSYIKNEVDFISVSPGTQKAMPWIPLLLLDDKLLTGTWNAYFTETGGEEQGPYEIGIDHEGNGMILCDSDRLYSGIVNGNEVSIDFGWAQFAGTIKNNSLMQGTYLGGMWRMEKQSDTSFCSELTFWDVDANGIPKFVTSDHIELNKIEKISKFRSGEGHDYSDDFESCRSMKHYYRPYSQLDWSQIKIFSPIDGTILKIELEGFPNSGNQVHIRSTAYPAFTFRIFHVNVNEALSVGDSVVAGQQIGTHISNITSDDIAVGVTTPDGWELVSFLSVMTDTLFQTYQNRGVQSRDDAIISKEARDSDPLNCTGETFGTSGTLENWINLE